MIRSCVTISLVPEARGGPFVFWDDLAAGCHKAKELGFDAVELFAPSPSAVDANALRRLLDETGLKVGAFGTGAGWLLQRLTLSSPETGKRAAAREFIRSIIDLAGQFHAPAIIGSMQGRHDADVDKATALSYLTEGVNDVGEHASKYGVPLLFEPLNRYETNLVNTVADGVRLLGSLSTNNVKLLTDLFHMNIEETDLAAALRSGAGHIGHVHFVDSNRRPAGGGHLDFAPIAAALRDMGYQGYVSAEALPYPDPIAAARQTMAAYRQYFAT
ncbi:MAG TPA: sugar phosphate isomerase/epimerase family protein [Gemmataceae bacterium]|nr:sugar phosphate isomerase/epimerase family protein [Gemmataceae bacterium]